MQPGHRRQGLRGHRPAHRHHAASRSTARGWSWPRARSGPTRSPAPSRPGLAGIECLAGIPGSAGATPDPERRRVRPGGRPPPSPRWSPTTARTRRDGHHPERRLRLLLPPQPLQGRPRALRRPARPLRAGGRGRAVRARSSTPRRPAPSASRPATGCPLADARETVLKLRAGKGMVLDPEDHDTWSAGSFFTNPILTDERVRRVPRARAGAPRRRRRRRPPIPAGDGRTKTSAAWLIDKAGFTKGYGTGPARISTKHTLALTNRGEATTEDLLALAREVVAGVQRGLRRHARQRAGDGGRQPLRAGPRSRGRAATSRGQPVVDPRQQLAS